MSPFSWIIVKKSFCIFYKRKKASNSTIAKIKTIIYTPCRPHSMAKEISKLILDLLSFLLCIHILVCLSNTLILFLAQ